MDVYSSSRGDECEHYLDLVADEEARSDGGKQSCFVTSAELFERLQDDSSLNEPVIEVQVYTEPQASWGPLTFLAGNHYFVVLETRNWWWSLELREGAVVIQRAKAFTNVQSRCQGRYRRYRMLQNGPSLLARCSSRQLRIRDIIFSMSHQGFFDCSLAFGDRPSPDLVDFVWVLCKVQQLSAASHVHGRSSFSSDAKSAPF
ncbi:hypothetical protein DQ04_01851020 [Trypanosoma grayi]|uniref:hypothetical protein n=1 Tax=Trypanosoma grayi TaxID=71804 RepID=UPI0004F416B7|nr:hypothetical protein DQ04_01851020 [Trypanosoma grayi]KEG12257.1 hypothetical protein DQ04_01851020 [Trypanosoma grayi]